MFYVEQFIWNVWGQSLICQAQRWGEDLPDNKLMKMSLTYTSISPFHKRSTEQINIVAKMLSLFFLNALILQQPPHSPSWNLLHACLHSQFEPCTLVWLKVEQGLCKALNDLLLYLDITEPRPCEARNRGLMGAMTAKAIPSAVVVCRKGQPPVHTANQMEMSVLARGKTGSREVNIFNIKSNKVVAWRLVV